MTPARAREKLEEVTTEITQLERRLAVSHGLGDASSAQGITHDFRDNILWRKRLDFLRGQRTMLESYLAGEPIGQPGITLSNFVKD
jgi:hypothetical protein